MKYSLPLLAGLLLVGCSNDASTETNATSTAATKVDGSKFVLADEPDAAADVLKVREDSEDGDEIVIVGRIGGSPDPWIQGRAAFSIVDCSATPCNEIPGDKCPRPWDYCCTSDLASKTTLVKFLNNDGKPLAAGARELFTVKELDTVVIQGKAKRDETGNLTVLASGIFVRRTK